MGLDGKWGGVKGEFAHVTAVAGRNGLQEYGNPVILGYDEGGDGE